MGVVSEPCIVSPWTVPNFEKRFFGLCLILLFLNVGVAGSHEFSPATNAKNLFTLCISGNLQFLNQPIEFGITRLKLRV
jgi:hypothetical protein